MDTTKDDQIANMQFDIINLQDNNGLLKIRLLELIAEKDAETDRRIEAEKRLDRIYSEADAALCVFVNPRDKLLVGSYKTIIKLVQGSE